MRKLSVLLEHQNGGGVHSPSKAGSTSGASPNPVSSPCRNFHSPQDPCDTILESGSDTDGESKKTGSPSLKNVNESFQRRSGATQHQSNADVLRSGATQSENSDDNEDDDDDEINDHFMHEFPEDGRGNNGEVVGLRSPGLSQVGVQLSPSCPNFRQHSLDSSLKRV